MYTVRQRAVKRVCVWGRKKNQFSFVCISFNTWQKLVNFLIYIKECISYNSVSLILARSKILRNNEVETINTGR